MLLFIYLCIILSGVYYSPWTFASSPSPRQYHDHQPPPNSWAVSLITICVFSIFGRGGAQDYSVDTINFLYILIAVMVMFFITHWEKYNTGCLYLPWSYDLTQYVSSRTEIVCKMCLHDFAIV